MPWFSASNFPKVARVNGVGVTPLGVVASAAPTTTARRASTLTPSVTSKIVRFIIYPFSLPQSSLIGNVPSVNFAIRFGVHHLGGRARGLASASAACGACRLRQRNEQRGKRHHHHD